MTWKITVQSSEKKREALKELRNKRINQLNRFMSNAQSSADAFLLHVQEKKAFTWR